MQMMKDSGKEWLGYIPVDWDIEKFKYHLSRHEINNKPNEVVLSLYRELGVIPKDSRDDNHNVTSENTTKYKYVQSGNFVVNKMKAWQGSVAVSNFTGIISPAYYVYRFTNPNICKKYFHYLLRGCYKDEFMRLSGGVRIGQWDLPAEKLENTFIIIPSSYDVQEQIANFLDEICGQIDSLIADIQSQIDTLEEYKKSIITEAVTKGLNPDVEMKDSGVEWIVRIPRHWMVKRGKYNFVLKSEKGNTNSLVLLSPTQKYGVIPQELYEQYSGFTAVKLSESTNLNLLKTVHKGAFVISLRSFEGGFEYSEYEGVVSPAYQVFYPSVPMYDRYYKYLFKTPVFIDKMNSYAMSLRDGKNIAFSDFGRTYIPIPPMDEQQEIVEYLDNKCVDIDAIISEKKEQLSTLAEYKKSLIYEYVTGKKEVAEA